MILGHIKRYKAQVYFISSFSIGAIFAFNAVASKYLIDSLKTGNKSYCHDSSNIHIFGLFEILTGAQQQITSKLIYVINIQEYL